MTHADPRSGDGADRADGDVLAYDLSPRVPVLRLESAGYRLIQRSGRSHQPLTLYGDVTHVASTERGFWLATRTGLFFARRSRFRAVDGPEKLAREVIRRIAAAPGGLRQMQQMAQVDHLARHPRSVRTTWVIVALCCLFFAAQLGDPFLQLTTAFDPLLVRSGEWWRLITANFVHSTVPLPLHIGFNVLGLVGFGFLVERSLGPSRVACILAAAALASMSASGLLRNEQVIGASGMVAGLAGAALCLELFWARKLPAWWRIPRRPFLILLGLQIVIDWSLPVIAGEAHIGGFVAGFAVTRLLGEGAMRERAAGRATRIAAWAAAVGTIAAVASVWPLWSRSADALESHGLRLLHMPDVGPVRDNHVAWVMATESDANPVQLEVAIALAERAVSDTARLNPDVLDTLAESLFAAGQSDRAIAVIEEAITLAPAEPYFWEQRKRFSGERDAEDRPSPPTTPWYDRGPLPFPLPGPDPHAPGEPDEFDDPDEDSAII